MFKCLLYLLKLDMLYHSANKAFLGCLLGKHGPGCVDSVTLGNLTTNMVSEITAEGSDCCRYSAVCEQVHILLLLLYTDIIAVHNH